MMRGFLLIDFDNVPPGYNSLSKHKGDEVDKQMYAALRQKLQNRIDEDELRDNWIRSVISAIQSSIQKLLDSERKVCEWGTLDDDNEFLPLQYRSNPSGFYFALKILFHSKNGKVIFQPTFPFYAEEGQDHIVFECEGEKLTVPLEPGELFREGIESIHKLLDKPLKGAVEALGANSEDA